MLCSALTKRAVEVEAKTTASYSRNLSQVCTDCTVYSVHSSHYLPTSCVIHVCEQLLETNGGYSTTNALFLHGWLSSTVLSYIAAFYHHSLFVQAERKQQWTEMDYLPEVYAIVPEHLLL